MIKLGGSVITYKDKPYTANHSIIRQLSEEISTALKEGLVRELLVGNGGGSFPHYPAKRGKLAGGIQAAWQLEHLVETHRAASELNHILITEMLKKRIPALSIKPSSAGYTRNGVLESFNLHLIRKALELGLVPVVYGDVFLDSAQGCSIVSTESILSYIAKHIKTEKIVIGTDVDGVLDEQGKLLDRITPSTFPSIKHHIGGSIPTDVTGGMLHKVEMMLRIVDIVPTIYIVNARDPGNILRALRGEEIGTRITR